MLTRLGLLVFLAAPLGAHAQALSDPGEEGRASLSLSLRGAEGCIEASALEASVDELLGRDAFVREEAELVVRVDLIRRTSALEVGFTIAPPGRAVLGERRVTLGPDCSEALAPIALIVAVLADVPRRALAPPPSTRPLAATIALSGGATSGWVPGDLNALLELRAGLREGQFSAEVLAMFVPEGRAEGTEGAVHAWTMLAGVALCGLAVVAEPIRLGACAEVGLGFSSSWASALAETRNVVRPQGMLGMSARLEWVVWPELVLRLEVGARSPFVRDRLRITPAGIPEVLFEPPTVTPHALVGFEVDLR